jgi:signal transduction histidine kinase
VLKAATSGARHMAGAARLHATARHVATEALTNVAKYAGASTTHVKLRNHRGWAEIRITDDGVGGAADSGGSGLRGLADRLDALGGRISVESTPGTGTTVRAGVPV